eukprot:TRINITY_DN6918_c0_g3_i1.p1 TRINITY_DN6918_c0_g3~~TRINITY_DN6918_c0_g3_i1.p1  ORF type:complete len:224 (+),score=30.98 TRINITY_DN6918_c0_g3_i1:363-1034(+)
MATKIKKSKLITTTPGNSSRSKAIKEVKAQQATTKKTLLSNDSSKQRPHASTLIKAASKCIQTPKKNIKLATSNCLGRLFTSKHAALNPATDKTKEKLATMKNKGYNTSRQPMLLLSMKRINMSTKQVTDSSKQMPASAREATSDKTKKHKSSLRSNENATAKGIKKQGGEKSRNKEAIKFLTNISNKWIPKDNEDSMEECRTVIEYDCDNDYSWIYNSLCGH